MFPTSSFFWWEPFFLYGLKCLDWLVYLNNYIAYTIISVRICLHFKTGNISSVSRRWLLWIWMANTSASWQVWKSLGASDGPHLMGIVLRSWMGWSAVWHWKNCLCRIIAFTSLMVKIYMVISVQSLKTYLGLRFVYCSYFRDDTLIYLGSRCSCIKLFHSICMLKVFPDIQFLSGLHVVKI